MIRQGVNSDGELIRSAYVEHQPVDFVCDDDGMTRQEFAAECDINTLMARYERTGVLPLRSGEPQYLDLTEMPPDLMSALAVMDAAERSFMDLPATVRREFDNDPVKFVEYASDRANIDQMREWGLAAPAPVADAITAPEMTPKPSGELPLDGGSPAPKTGA